MGEACVDVDSKKQVATGASGAVYPYDKLLIATGGYAVKPAIKGVESKGVFVLRTLDDAKEIEPLAQPGAKAVVIGGGFVSLKAAYALLERGVQVTCIISSGHILSRMLDESSADDLAAFLIEHGLKVEYHSDVKEIIPKDGRVDSVLLTDGRQIPADFMIIGKGVLPNIGFLAGSGLEADDAIKTNVFLRTNLENVYAAGDCINSFDLVEKAYRNNALWPNAAEQGKFAGDNMSGKKTPYHGSIAMNAATFFGRALIGGGMIQKEAADGFEVALYSHGDTVRRRLVFRDDVLVGFYLVGDIGKAGILTHYIRTGLHLGKVKKDLLEGKFSTLLRYPI